MINQADPSMLNILISIYRKCAILAVEDACKFLDSGGEVAVSMSMYTKITHTHIHKMSMYINMHTYIQIYLYTIVYIYTQKCLCTQLYTFM